MSDEQVKPLRQWWIVAGLLWLVRYVTLGTIPLLGEPTWAGWFDQSRYLTSARALSSGVLAADAHWYPLGYPLAAAPMAWLVPSDPFFLLDLILFLLTCGAFRNVARGLGMGPWTATWCFLATTLVQTGLASAWAHPWTTTLSAALIWWLVDRVLGVARAVPDRYQPFDLVAIGGLSAALPLVRPVDALLSLTCLAALAIALLHQRRLRTATVLPIAAGAVIVIGPYAALHLAIYGPHPTAYMVAASSTGFIWQDLAWKAYILLVDPRPWFPDGKAILEALPWIVPGLAGLAGVAVVGGRQERWTIVFLLALIVPVSALMLTYADLQPPGLWYHCNIHYFKWAMPAFGAGVVLCWRLLRTRRGRLVLAPLLVGLILPLGIRIRPVPVDDRQPARMLFYRSDAHRAPEEVYVADARIVDDEGLMRNVGDFRQLADARGARAIAVSRRFQSSPRRSDPGEPIFRHAQLPYARFGEKVSFLEK